MAKWTLLSELPMPEVLSHLWFQCMARALRMRSMRTAIYRNPPNPDAQHQALLMEVAVGHVLYAQFIQRHILGSFGQVGWDILKKRL